MRWAERSAESTVDFTACRSPPLFTGANPHAAAHRVTDCPLQAGRAKSISALITRSRSLANLKAACASAIGSAGVMTGDRAIRRALISRITPNPSRSARGVPELLRHHIKEALVRRVALHPADVGGRLGSQVGAQRVCRGPRLAAGVCRAWSGGTGWRRRPARCGRRLSNAACASRCRKTASPGTGFTQPSRQSLPSPQGWLGLTATRSPTLTLRLPPPPCPPPRGPAPSAVGCGPRRNRPVESTAGASRKCHQKRPAPVPGQDPCRRRPVCPGAARWRQG